MTRLDRTNAVHHVYRCFDETGRLVYVGSSTNVFGRLDQHRNRSWWAGQVAAVTAKVYPNGTVARESERLAIRTESPRWNKAGRWNTRHEWTQDQWDDWLTMLLNLGTFARELRNFVDLYRRTWGCDPDAVQVAAVAAVEQDAARRAVEWEAQIIANRARVEAMDREDEIGLRRERKDAKARAKRLRKKAKKAAALVAEYDLAVDKS